MKIIVGLGNPGRKYAGSRHNVGFTCIDGISYDLGISMSQRRPLAVIGQGWLGQEEVVLVKPLTFMNNSGEAIAYLNSRFHTSLQDLIIIYDDMDLVPGKIRIRPSGSAGGHRGMESILGALKSPNFTRIRIGIGHPPTDMNQVKFVLGNFTAEENPLIQEAVANAQKAAVDVMVHGPVQAMNHYN
jgi:PTH1 family peptidyl-tRNA hydrolase